MYTDT